MLCANCGEALAQSVPDFIPNAEEQLLAPADSAYLPVVRDILSENLENARAELSSLPVDYRTSFEGQFLLAEIERRTGHLEAAIGIYREMLASDPALDRVRLELAVTLIAAGQDAAAKTELFRVLRNSPPGVVASRIRNVLAAIDLRRAFIWDAGILLVGDSNINAAPRDRTVTIFGLPFELSDDSREHSGFGLSAAAAAEWRLPLTTDWRARLGGSVFALDYAGENFDFQGFGLHAGVQALHERWLGSLLIVGAGQRYGGKPYSSSYGVRTEATWSPSERIAVQVMSDFQHVSYSNYGLVSGNHWNVGLVPAFAPRSYFTTWLALGYGERDSHASMFAYQSKRLGLGARVDTDWGVSLSAEADAIAYDYRATNPFFGIVQHDTLAWGYLALSAPRFSVLDLVPRIALSYSNNFSNVPVYRYERTSLELSFNRRF